MKIVYVFPALNTVGGADRVITEKMNYLAENFGYEMYVVTAHQNNAPLFFPLSSKVRHVDLDVNFHLQYGKPVWKRACIYFTLLRQYKKKLKRFLLDVRPDITVTTISRDIDFLYKIHDGSLKMAEAHVAKPFIRNLHRLEHDGFLYRVIGKIWRHKLEYAIKRFDVLVVLTEHDARSWGNGAKKLVVMPNSMPFSPSESSSCSSKKVISVGRLDEQKGYDMLVDAWQSVYERHPDWHLYIYGNGALQEVLERRIKAKGLGGVIHLCAPVKDIEAKYMESAFYVMSSRFEGFGMVLIEAMACGLPCVSFDCPCGPSDIIRDGEDGLLVTNGDVRQLSQKMERLIQDGDLRRRMGRKARENVMRYSKDRIMGQWKELYEQLVRR